MFDGSTNNPTKVHKYFENFLLLKGACLAKYQNRSDIKIMVRA
jgi:hypothetical protein